MHQNRKGEPVRTKRKIRNNSTPPRMAFSLCWFWKVSGAPDILPSSFRKAMTEPEKVTAPMARPSDISSSEAPLMFPGMPMPKLSGA